MKSFKTLSLIVMALAAVSIGCSTTTKTTPNTANAESATVVAADLTSIRTFSDYQKFKSDSFKEYQKAKSDSFKEYQEENSRLFKVYQEGERRELDAFRSADFPAFQAYLELKEYGDYGRLSALERTSGAYKTYKDNTAALWKVKEDAANAAYKKHEAADKEAYSKHEANDKAAYDAYKQAQAANTAGQLRSAAFICNKKAQTLVCAFTL